MGREKEKDSRQGTESPFARFQVNAELMAHADPGAVFLHCLPAYRGYEVTEDVIDGPQSVVGTSRRTGCTPRRRSSPGSSSSTGRGRGRAAP